MNLSENIMVLLKDVHVLMDSMMLVNKNVDNVELNVLLVIEITTVSLVTILTTELSLTVNVQPVGKMLLMV
jgi:hypothetical protein